MTHTLKNKKLFSKIIKKLLTYFTFTIVISWLPIFFSWLIARLFKLNPKPLYLYTSEIYFLTIILSSTNIKDIIESKISKESFIFIGHVVINAVNIALCITLISITTYNELTEKQFNRSIINEQFSYAIIMYFLAVFLGSGVQIGCAIKQIIEFYKRGINK